MSADYPLSEKHADRLSTPSGIPFREITLEALMEGKVRMEHLRISAEALEMQARIAEAAGRPQLAENLRRAAELVGIPDEEILQIYESLRPGRASREDLLRRAGQLDKRGARRCAALVREAAASTR